MFDKQMRDKKDYNQMRDRKDYNWEKFKEFCEEEGISTESPEDYEGWWKCWKFAWKVGYMEEEHPVYQK